MEPHLSSPWKGEEPPIDKNVRCIYNVNMKTVINIKTDKETKEKAQKIAAEFGLNLSAMLNACMQEIIRTRRLSFTLDETPSPWLEKVLEEAEKDIASGKNLSPVLTTPEEITDWLNKPENERHYS